MRGALARWLINAVVSRIIPAYAGSTGVAVVLGEDAQDHPRVCGEHSEGPVAMMDTWGSSPRMRGAQNPQGKQDRLSGIIPAYAGSTLTISHHQGMSWDHPRVCGEHSKHRRQFAGQIGSSPRMRGALGSLPAGDIV